MAISAALFKGTPTWAGIKNASQIKGTALTSLLSGLKTASTTVGNTPAEKASNLAYYNSIEEANNTGRQIVAYTNSNTGSKAIAVQMSNKQIANAVQSYMKNPDVFKGVFKS